MREAVVITGLGVIGTFGCGARALAEGLTAGEPCRQEVERPPGYHRRGGARTALPTDRSGIDRYLSARAARRMSWLSRYGAAAAAMAVEAAGLDRSERLGDETAVVTATTFGSPTVTAELLRAILEEGPEAASPMLFPESVANAPAAQIAIRFGARGPNLTMTQRSAGALLAVGRAAREIRRGRAHRALAGVADEIHPIQHAVLDRFRALATDRGEGEAARPFDRDRNGFLLADGSAMLMLERRPEAEARGAPVLARIAAAGGAFDPSAPPEGWGRGEEALGAGLERLLARAGVEPGGVGKIVSGASGAVAGDALEAAVLRRVWGGRTLPPVLAPKAVVGEFGGGFLAAAVLAATGRAAAPTAAFRTPDPEFGLVPYPGGALEEGGLTLVSTLAAGGAAAWLLLAAEPGG